MLCAGRQLVVTALGFGDPILPDLVEQGFVADLQNGRGLLAIPVGLFEGAGNGLRLGFIFRAAGQRF